MTCMKICASAILATSIFMNSNAMAVPFVFINGTVTDANEINANFASFFRGDGSAGDITIDATNDNWSNASELPANLSFADFLIPVGVTLTVPAGTTIRCSGTFTNDGTINVLGGAENATTGFASSVISASGGPSTAAHPGDTPKSATTGQFDNNAIAVVKTLIGGQGGGSIPQAVTRASFGQFKTGGGAGGGNTTANRGGGLLKVYCGGAIANTGSINATGAVGGTGGGGGGGIVILASQTSVDNVAGTIDVSGADGGISGSFFGASGGGGGGVVVMISPTAPVVGTEIVAGGAGAVAGTTTTQSRLAGSGGGGSGGAGGNGGNVAGNTANAGSAGSAGYVITMTSDPGHLAR